MIRIDYYIKVFVPVDEAEDAGSKFGNVNNIIRQRLQHLVDDFNYGKAPHLHARTEDYLISAEKGA